MDIKPVHTKYTTIDSNENVHAKRNVANGKILFSEGKEMEAKKILGINSTVMNGIEKTTVTKITSKGITLTGKKGEQSLTFPLKDAEAAIKAGRWKVVDND